MELRTYQKEAILSIVEAHKEYRRVCYCLATGGGKTVILAELTRQTTGRVLILVHLKELISQVSDKLTASGVEHGIITGEEKQLTSHVSIAMVQTLTRNPQMIDAPALMIIDECHHAVAKSYKKLQDAYPEAKILGVTATPCLIGGYGLKEAFDYLIVGSQADDLIKLGYLSKPKYFAPAKLDVSSLSKSGGDFNKHQTSELMEGQKGRVVTGKGIEHYKLLALGQRALVFCTTIKHAEIVAKEFIDAGFNFRVLHSGLSDSERNEIVAGYRDGKILGLVTVDVVSEGFDIPDAAVAILLRPTDSLRVHRQQIGRVLRVYEGKARAIVLDCVGNIGRHGIAEDSKEWTLDGRIQKGAETVECRNCSAIFKPDDSRECPECGVYDPPAFTCAKCGQTSLAEYLNVNEESLKKLRYIDEAHERLGVSKSVPEYGENKDGTKKIRDRVCHICGHNNYAKSRPLTPKEEEGVLKELNAIGKRILCDDIKAKALLNNGRRKTFTNFQEIARVLGYKSGWAWHMFTEQYRRRKD